MTREQVNAFLEELGALTIKHNIKISGCHCCGSPRLDVLEPEEANTDYAYHIDNDPSFLGYSDLEWQKI